MTNERTFPNTTASIGGARRFALDELTGVSADVADAVAVMVSELATNSVRHAGTDFAVSIDQETDKIRVSVTDAGGDLPSVKFPAPNEHSGRGLQIVSALADTWGVSEMLERGGKTVWFVLALQPRSGAPATESSERSDTGQRADRPGGGEPQAASRKPTRRARARRTESRTHRSFAHRPAGALQGGR